MDPSNLSFLFGVIFHFHDYGRKGISFLIFPHPSVSGFQLWILVGLKRSFMGWYGVVVDNLCIFGWREPMFNLHYRLVFQCLGSTQGTWYFRKWDRGIGEDVGGIFYGKVQNYLWYHDLVTSKKGFFYAFSKPRSLALKENLSGSPTVQRLRPKTCLVKMGKLSQFIVSKRIVKDSSFMQTFGSRLDLVFLAQFELVSLQPYMMINQESLIWCKLVDEELLHQNTETV